ncbi:MAG: hypothetical protein KBA06_00755, partial [Saprospiraceae bacterium]|nr:hypothetical protein [Saprospiraceae bacterium]
IIFIGKNSINRNNKIRTALMNGLLSEELSNKINADKFYKDIYWDKYFFENNIIFLIDYLSQFSPLKAVFSKVIGSATVGEAYKIKDFIVEKDNQVNYLKLINTGTIDPFTSLWGIKKTQYIKGGYSKPIIEKLNLASISKTRLIQSESPKIIIAGMSIRVEAFYDVGEYCAGKSTSIILDNPQKLKTLTGLLNSKIVSFWFSKYYNSLSMAGGFFNIGNNELNNIPLPKIEFSNNTLITLVDYLLSLHNKETPQILSHTDNTRIASHLEDILNMMVYELYFEEHMKEVGIDVLSIINEKFKMMNEKYADKDFSYLISHFYEWYQQPDNPVRQRLLLVDTRSPDIIGLINKSV